MVRSWFDCCLLFCTASLLPAQGGVDGLVVQSWHGSGSAARSKQLQLAIDAAAFAALWAEHRPGEAPPVLDFGKVSVVAMFAGKAAAGDVRIREVLRGEQSVVLRLMPVPATDASGAYGIFAIAKGAANAQVESNEHWEPGSPAWQWLPFPIGLCAAAALPEGVQVPAPAAEIAGLALAAPGARWIDDVVALRALLGVSGKNTEVSDVDFSRFGVLCVRTEVAKGQVLQWQPALLGDDHWLVRLRRCAALPAGDAVESQPSTQAWVVPRPQLPIAVELGTDNGGVPAWQEFAHLDPRSPARAPRLTVLRSVEIYDSGQRAPLCRRIESETAWRELQREMKLPDPVLAAGWVDFARAAVVVVATGKGRVWPGFGFAIGQEEDVDVLTLLQTAPSGEDPGQHTPMVVVQVPRRRCELAVVLRLSCGPAPAGERTLGHFEGLR